MGIGLVTELDAVSSYSEIVPDTVVFDDFERSISDLEIYDLFLYLSGIRSVF